ncbi:MAG: hypothetical protein Q7S31_02890 [bacterium]|nr:hypothetical protein [bacterium]
MTDKQKLNQLEEKLAHYKKIFLDKKRNFRGVKHESSLSELRYTEFMVYKNIVEGLEREIKNLRVKS